MDEYTWEILADCWTPYLIKRIAARQKLHPDTVGAWKRPPQSDEFPTGTGKTNLIDQIKRLIDDIAVSHPGAALRISEHISKHTENRLRSEGITLAYGERSPCTALAESVKEHSDVVILLAARPNDPAAWKQARKEIREGVSSLMKLDGCLENLIERGEGQLVN